MEATKFSYGDRKLFVGEEIVMKPKPRTAKLYALDKAVLSETTI